MSELRDSRRRFQELARDRLEEALANMPEQQAAKLIAMLRKKRHNRQAGLFERIRREHAARAETHETTGVRMSSRGPEASRRSPKS